jgi:hypothetical protein
MHLNLEKLVVDAARRQRSGVAGDLFLDRAAGGVDVRHVIALCKSNRRIYLYGGCEDGALLVDVARFH